MNVQAYNQWIHTAYVTLASNSFTISLATSISCLVSFTYRHLLSHLNSSKTFTVLRQISLEVFLLQIPVAMTVIFSLDSIRNFKFNEMFSEILWLMLLTLGLSVLVAVLLVRPVCKIVDAVFRL